MSIYDAMKKYSVTLPTPTMAKGRYGMITTFADHYIYTAGTGCAKDGKPLKTGLLGDTVTVEEGQEAAEQCAKNILANVEKAIGSLDKIKRIVKTTVFIAATSYFTQQSAVGDGASELFKKLLGENNIGVRSAIGVSSLPRGQSVEIEVIFELKDGETVKC
jgi:enamine deaminase RidA (YjgF/YER057c/UK114 family)